MVTFSFGWTQRIRLTCQHETSKMCVWVTYFQVVFVETFWYTRTDLFVLFCICGVLAYPSKVSSILFMSNLKYISTWHRNSISSMAISKSTSQVAWSGWKFRSVQNMTNRSALFQFNWPFFRHVLIILFFVNQINSWNWLYNYIGIYHMVFGTFLHLLSKNLTDNNVPQFLVFESSLFHLFLIAIK